MFYPHAEALNSEKDSEGVLATGVFSVDSAPR